MLTFILINLTIQSYRINMYMQHQQTSATVCLTFNILQFIKYAQISLFFFDYAIYENYK